VTSLKEQLFTACAVKTCCEVDTVFPSATDTGRIARMLSVPASAFCVTEPAAPGDPDAFLLAGGPVRVALAHRARPDGEPGGCIFLLRLPDGSGRCSLGSERPSPCLSFPCVIEDGVVAIGGESCTCRAWSLGEIDPVQERELLEREAREREDHRALAARWNAAADPAVTVDDLLGFLLAEAVA
jgi:Fe-S-cluster containining protein